MTPAAEPPFDLEALEFDAVRRLLLERLATPLGRSAVQGLAPFATAAEANGALALAARIAERLRAEDPPPLGSAVEVRSWLPGFFAGEHVVQVRDLADLKRTLRAAVLCTHWLERDEGNDVSLRTAAAFPPLGDLVSELEMVLDDRGEILDSASEKLAGLRREIEGAEAGVQAAVRRFLASGDWGRVLQTPEPAWRHGRPVFPVRAEHRHRVSGVMHDRSQSGATVFIEPDVVVEAANRLADLRAAEHREIQVVLAQVGRGLRRVRSDIEGAIEAFAALDLANAKARCIVEDGYRAVAVEEDGPLAIRGGRHPLLVRSLADPEDLVPLDVSLGDPHRVLVVTGPNTGGKTVAVKTLGLLAAMGVCGVPVPAGEGTRLPFLRTVLADIGDEQEIEQSLSTFSSHVTRIARCLAAAGPRTLVLLDELGAGTDPEEGGVLGYAVLEELLRRGGLAVVTTHLGRLKEFAYRHDGAENGAMAFDGGTLKPLYRLDVGIPGASHALDIARRVGLPGALVDRARELLGERDGALEEVMDQVQRARRKAEEDRRRTEQLTRKAAATDQKVEERLAEAERREAWLEEEADAVVEEQVRALRDALDKPLTELCSAPGEHGRRARELRDRLHRALEGTSIHRRRMRFLGGLRRDHAVYLPRWDRRAVVRKIDRVREIVVVEHGKARMEVPFEDVSWLEPL